MRFFRLTICLCLALAGSACKTQRTVLAGPTVTGLDSQGHTSTDAHFGNQDPGGYQQNANDGLNAMSEKMFGGKLQSQSEKEFAANKNFLTREFGGKKNFAAKTWQGEPKNKTWTDKLFDTDETSEGDMAFREGERSAVIKDSPEANKIARTNEYADGTRAARTNNYRPAEKALEAGRDEPKLASARSDRPSAKEKLIRDRISNSNASASEISKFLGKP
jgi:phage-related protein